MPAYTSERTSIEFKNMTPPNTKPHGMARPRTRKSVQRHHVFYTPTTRSSFRLSAFTIDPSLASSRYFVCHTPLMISVLEPSRGVFRHFSQETQGDRALHPVPSHLHEASVVPALVEDMGDHQLVVLIIPIIRAVQGPVSVEWFPRRRCNESCAYRPPYRRYAQDLLHLSLAVLEVSVRPGYSVSGTASDEATALSSASACATSASLARYAAAITATQPSRPSLARFTTRSLPLVIFHLPAE